MTKDSGCEASLPRRMNIVEVNELPAPEIFKQKLNIGFRKLK